MGNNHWKWGVFYFDPNDKAVFVQKRFGIGWTLNFAHPAAWILLLLTIALITAIPILKRR